MKFKKSQSVFEYFIITATIAAVAVIFSSSSFWTKVNTSLNNSFKSGVEDMAK